MQQEVERDRERGKKGSVLGLQNCQNSNIHDGSVSLCEFQLLRLAFNKMWRVHARINFRYVHVRGARSGAWSK